MTNRNRDLLLLSKTTYFSGPAFEKQLDALHEVLLKVECHEAFCAAHELVTRTSITSKTLKIINAISRPELKPFHFLINKN